MLLFGDVREYAGEIGKGESMVEIGFSDVTTESVDTMESTWGIKSQLVRGITVGGDWRVVSDLIIKKW
jgi:hypothetical protein